MGTEPNFDLIPFILPARMVVLSFGQCRNLHHKIKGSLKILKFKSFIKLFIFLLPHTLILSDGVVVRVRGFEPEECQWYSEFTLDQRLPLEYLLNLKNHNY